MLVAIWRAIRHELGTKIFAIVVAIGLWLYVMHTENPIRRETIMRPVEVVNVSPELDVVKVTPQWIGVEVTGRLQDLRRLRVGNARVIADAAGAGVGNCRLRVQVVGEPDRVTVRGTTPRQVQVLLDRRTAKDVRVVPLVRGRPAEGFEVWGMLTAHPERVRVIGATTRLERITRVVARVDVSGESTTRSGPANLEALDARDERMEGFTFEPPTVTVTVPIVKVETRRVPVRVRLSAPAPGYSIKRVKVEPATVLVKGPVELLNRVGEVKTRVVEIGDMTESGRRFAQLVVSEQVALAEHIRSVSVNVELTAQSRRSPAGAGSGRGPVQGSGVSRGEGQPEQPTDTDASATSSADRGGAEGRPSSESRSDRPSSG